MGTEYERKFLVKNRSWVDDCQCKDDIEQFYLTINNKNTVRVRIINDKEAFLTVKSNDLVMARDEYEFPIPLEDAIDMRSLSHYYSIYKTRHTLKWEISSCKGCSIIVIDVFKKANRGIVIAEVEFLCKGTMENFIPLDWMGEEVTGNKDYYNVTLAKNPIGLEN